MMQYQAAEPTFTNPQLKNAMKYWLDCIDDWYPDRRTKTYFSPPLHFNRIPYGLVLEEPLTILVKLPPDNRAVKPNASATTPTPIAGNVYVPAFVSQEKKKMVQTNDVIEDATFTFVRTCLQNLAESQREIMMGIFGLDFANYLDKQADPTHEAACKNLPRPCTIPNKDLQRGEFDMLIVHRQYGLIVGEIKSVGATSNKVEDLKAYIRKRVQKAMKQLVKEGEVLKHLVNDIAPVHITKTFILPFVTSGQLKETLSGDLGLMREFCDALDSPDLSSALRLCLCKDQMPSIVALQGHSRPVSSADQTFRVSGDAVDLSLMVDWWKQITAEKGGQDENMSDGIYDHLLARFCGPATTVLVPTVTAPRKVLRTQGNAVAETGLIMCILCLYPDQARLLNDLSLLSLHLYGPPGTGKTLMLVLKACQWLKQGCDVHVVSVRKDSRAVCYLIEAQLNAVLASSPLAASGCRPRVCLHRYDFHASEEDVATAVNDLALLARDDQIHVIADEMLDFFCTIRFYQFCESLKERVSSLSLWCTSMEKLKSKPPWLQEEPLTTPLRSPPTVYREVVKCKEIVHHSYILPYDCPLSPQATSGPDIVWLYHRDQPGHSSGPSEECEVCGSAIAQQLRNIRDGDGDLQLCDVLVLCQNPRDEVRNETGQVVQPALGIVRGLRGDQNLVVTVLTKHATEDARRNVALALKDEVVVADYETVAGLERRIVVCVGRGESNSEASKETRDIDSSRLFAMSRSTSLVIWIDTPSD